MRTSIRVFGIAKSALCRAATEQQLSRLEALADISTAEAVVARSTTLNPPYHVHVVLAVPGPDIHAAAADHTFAAAIRKVMKKLEHQIAARKSRRLERRKSNLRNAVRGSFDTFAIA